MLSKTISKLSVPFAEFSLRRNIRRKMAKINLEFQAIENNRNKWKAQNLFYLTKHCKQNVPYYTDLFAKTNFHPENILKDLKYFEDIEPLNKSLLKANTDKLLSKLNDKSQLFERKTNGSTGENTSVFYDQEALDWSSATSFYTQELLGKKLSENEIYITSQDIVNNTWSKIISEKAKCVTLNRKNVYYKDLGDDELDTILKTLKNHDPKIVHSTPSIIYALSQYLYHTPTINLKLNKIITTGELLDPIKKERIESTFNCKVYNRYGNAEVGIIAQDTTTDHLKVIEPMCHVENIGNSSELFITGLKNSAMPLLRYATGDNAKVSESEIGCFISDLKGRIGDMIYLNGSLVPTEFIKDTLFRIANIDDFQIRKSKRDGYIMTVVCDKPMQSLVKKKVQEIWKNQFQIRFSTMQDLSRVGLRSKFSYLIDETI